VTHAKNVMTMYAVGDPKEQFHNELLEILGKQGRRIDRYYFSIDIIVKTLGKPP